MTASSGGENFELKTATNNEENFYYGGTEEEIFALSPAVLRKWLASVTARQKLDGAVTIMPIITVEFCKSAFFLKISTYFQKWSLIFPDLLPIHSIAHFLVFAFFNF